MKKKVNIGDLVVDLNGKIWLVFEIYSNDTFGVMDWERQSKCDLIEIKNIQEVIVLPKNTSILVLKRISKIESKFKKEFFGEK